MLSKAARQSLEIRFGVDNQQAKTYWAEENEQRSVTPKVVNKHRKVKKVVCKRRPTEDVAASMCGANEMNNSL